MKLLSILICTIDSRRELFESLLLEIQFQLNNIEDGQLVEVLFDSRDELVTTGQKRNDLIGLATGKYIVFIDDDDEISHDYCSLILRCIKDNDGIDCIGISGTISYNGKNHKKWKISKDHERNVDRHDILIRQTNHISPVRREIAQKALFTITSYGEDYAYSAELQKFLKKEAVIDKEIYHYRYAKELDTNMIMEDPHGDKSYVCFTKKQKKLE